MPTGLFLRRLLLGVALLVLGPSTIHAQVVESDPALPTQDAPVTIFFNADEGSGGLEDFTGDVYAHTGIYTTESPDEWKCVKNYWPTDSNFSGLRDDTQMTRVSANRYRLDISTSPRAYYQDTSTSCTLAEGEQITSLNFVFRSADGSVEGKAAGGGDIFVDVASSSGADVSITAPTPSDDFSPVLVSSSTGSVTVDAEAVLAQGETLRTFRLIANGTVFETSTTASVSGVLSLDAPGADVTVTAEVETDAGGVARDELRVVRNPTVTDEAVPAGVQDGVTINSPTSATFSLMAPGKANVYLVGDFNNWQIDPDYFMKRDPNGGNTRFWLQVDGLQGDTEYGYQYVVEGTIRIPDPYTEKALSANDRFISDATFPDLKPYPEDQTEQLVSTFTTTPSDVAFSDFERPDQSELVIYELLVRDFVEKHDFATLTDTLDYIDRLGVNAIELMPINEFDGNESWGYNPNLHYAVDKYYGPPDDLKRFIDEAHQRGIAVILDVVYNHATGQSPLVRLFNDGTFGQPTSENPWYNRNARHPFNVFNDMNHESQLTKDWLDRVNRFWLEEYNVDGFRFDLSKGFTQTQTNNTGAWSAYDQSRVDLLTRMADAIWAVDDQAYIILEHLGSIDEERVLTEYGTGDGNTDGTPGMMVWKGVGDAYNQSSMGYSSNSNFSATYYQYAGYNVPNTVAYMESHDEQWLMYKNIAFGNSSGDYDVTELATALERQKLVGTFFFTVPGPRMLWQFGELGYGYGDNGEQCLKPGGGGNGDCAASAPGRTDKKPIRWDYRDPQQSPDRVRLYKTWSALINLRMQNPVFHDTDTQILGPLLGDGDFGNRRLILDHPTPGEMDAVIVGNFGVTESDVTPDFPDDTDGDGVWYDFFTGESFEVNADNRDASVTFDPGEFHIFTSEVPVGGFPEPGLTNFGPPGAPLPVELVDFSATRQGDDTTVLTWNTASETNNAGFQIQRRLTRPDEREGTFERIGFVEGAGTTSSPQTYRFTDRDLPFEATEITYRLRQVDVDGAASLSQNVVVAMGPPQQLALHGAFPNPANGSATLRYELPEAGPVQIAVYNLLGQRVAQLANKPHTAGRHTLSVNTSGLASGSYFIRMESPSGIRTTRLTVVR